MSSLEGRKERQDQKREKLEQCDESASPHSKDAINTKTAWLVVEKKTTFQQEIRSDFSSKSAHASVTRTSPTQPEASPKRNFASAATKVFIHLQWSSVQSFQTPGFLRACKKDLPVGLAHCMSKSRGKGSVQLQCQRQLLMLSKQQQRRGQSRNAFLRGCDSIGSDQYEGEGEQVYLKFPFELIHQRLPPIIYLVTQGLRILDQQTLQRNIPSFYSPSGLSDMHINQAYHSGFAHPTTKQRNGQYSASAAPIDAVKAATMARTKEKRSVHEGVMSWVQINLKGKIDLVKQNKILSAVWRSIKYHLAKPTRNKTVQLVVEKGPHVPCRIQQTYVM
ncbi:hypothetical protein EDD22DRAFT_846068 [Suillus occidentalis]|nr:hypothetical protein EDD22DRAFT_846068 [Suillus occidentalis]